MGAYVYAMVLITLVLGGVFYIALEEVDNVLYNDITVELGVPTTQRVFFHNIWVYGVPIAILMSTLIWAFTVSQKKKG